MKRVILVSPFAGNMLRRFLNVRFARQCLKDALARGEAPFASHLLYPQALNDSNERDRRQGMACGYTWLQYAELVAVYVDRGITSGMMGDIDTAETLGLPVEYRALDPKHQLPK